MSPELQNDYKMLTEEQLHEAAECLKVMAHPARLNMVQILMQSEFPVHEIASLCRISANQTCEHLRLMQGRGLLTSRREGKIVYYKIANPRLPGLIHCIRKNCEVKSALEISDNT